MDEERFEDIELGWASDMAAFLSGLPQAELALLFQEAESLIRELKAVSPDEQIWLEMPQDSHAILTALVITVVNQLGAGASENLLALKRKLDEETRLKRMLE